MWSQVQYPSWFSPRTVMMVATVVGLSLFVLVTLQESSTSSCQTQSFPSRASSSTSNCPEIHGQQQSLPQHPLRHCHLEVDHVALDAPNIKPVFLLLSPWALHQYDSVCEGTLGVSFVCERSNGQNKTMNTSPIFVSVKTRKKCPSPGDF